jgi:type VI secretion system secreted protein VgrG
VNVQVASGGPSLFGLEGLPDTRIYPRPTITGVQTALVGGLGEPVHTDRDQRIKVQFHWQRGANGSHRLHQPSGEDNAPTNDSSGTWVRVATPMAGQNWGSVFTPRLGQEVLVGSVYNGQGQGDAQGNQVARGGSGASGNAPAWFAGSQRKDQKQGHAHNAVLSGPKSQELPSSISGTGGHNQFVFDDSPQANRIELSTTQAATRPSQTISFLGLLIRLSWVRPPHVPPNKKPRSQDRGFFLVCLDTAPGNRIVQADFFLTRP